MIGLLEDGHQRVDISPTGVAVNNDRRTRTRTRTRARTHARTIRTHAHTHTRTHAHTHTRTHAHTHTRTHTHTHQARRKQNCTGWAKLPKQSTERRQSRRIWPQSGHRGRVQEGGSPSRVKRGRSSVVTFGRPQEAVC